MMVTNDEIRQWLNGAAPDAERVAELAAAAPWFALPAAMRLRNAKVTDAERRELSARLALLAADPEQMAMAADTDLALDLAAFYPVEPVATPGTSDTIEKFLDTYGNSSEAENVLLERLIFNPTADYAQMLAREEEKSMPQADDAPDGTPESLINSFIIRSKAAGGQFPPAVNEPRPEPKPKPTSEVKKPAPTTDSMLSESLARIYIKKGKFSKAYEIISHLNLNFPEKSIYFADQLRFLEKLIAIEERKSMRNNENNN